MLGTFYRAEAPGAAPFVEVGANVGPETTVCIIEVMKMMNSVPAGVSGTIAEICSENGHLVEYGEPLVPRHTRRMRRVFIPNRGEIAVRIVNACHKLGLECVVGASEPDMKGLAARIADRVVCIGPGPGVRELPALRRRGPRCAEHRAATRSTPATAFSRRARALARPGARARAHLRRPADRRDAARR